MLAGISEDGPQEGRREADLTLTRPLTCTLSPANGEAGPSMQRFLQEHVMSILQPLAEHVQELQEQTRLITRDLGLTDARVYGYLSKLEAHEQQLNDHKASHAETGEALHRLRKELAGACDQHSALHRQHTETRGDLGRTSRDLKTAAVSLEQLQQALRQAVEESSSAASRIRSDLAETNGRTARLQASVADLLNGHEGLAQEVRGDLAHSVQGAVDLGNLNAKRVEKLTGTMDTQREDQERLFQDLRVSDHRLAQELRAKGEALELAQAAALAALKGEVCSLGRAEGQDELLKALKEKLQAQQSDFSGRMSKIEGMFDEMAKSFGDMMGGGGSEKGGSEDGGGGGVNFLAELGKAVKQASTDVKQQAGYVRHLREADERRGRQLQSIDVRVGGLEDRSHELVQRTDAADARLKACEASQREATNTLEAQRLEMDRTRHQQQQMSTSLGGNTANLRIVSDHLRNVGQDMARQGARLEVAHEYIDGMGKGFQDTHRRVLNGHDGLLPPKSGSLTARGLPKLVWSSGLGGEGREAFPP